MQPRPYLYKAAYVVFALALLLTGWRTLSGVAAWAWHVTVGPDTTQQVHVDPTPARDTGDYTWPH